ncbi:MAG: adenylyl-sulfate kinase [Desulfarculaceae bacterium]|nr:adenylyl-sulfate kinase [Desulfarculaceae bacterium]MCF8072108.1 adenylyl-sulfate kinase [Desulfarculaceae bacterium]MCF8100029.1 adenylyl-sulfate kinase [Desulfarculaceae bacterium]
MQPAFTVWLTGPPNSGKTTLAEILRDELTSLDCPVELFDGNILRDKLSPNLGFSRSDREMHCRRVAYFCSVLNRHGVACIVALIAPYEELRQELRQEIPEYYEVFLDCPLDTLAARDTKGLYAKALAGELPNFTGVTDPYEIPAAAELTLDTQDEKPEQCVAAILRGLREQGLLPGLG